MNSRQLPAAALLLSCALVSPLAFLQIFSISSSADTVAYTSLLKGFSEEFWAGHLYPRWINGTYSGLGSALFLFYSPLPYFLGSLLQWLAPIDPYGTVRLLLVIQLALLTMAWAAYAWLIRVLPAQGQYYAPLLFLGLPYFIVAQYLTLNLAALWAMAAVCFTLRAAEDMTQTGARALPLFAVGYALLTLSHIFSMVMFSAIPLAYVFYFSPSEKRFRHLVTAFAGSFIGIGLCAIYWLPAVLNSSYLGSGFNSGKYDYSQNFFSISSWESWLWLFLAVTPLLVCRQELSMAEIKKILGRWGKFWVAVTICGIWLTTSLSKPVWMILPVLQNLQFPLRMMCVPALAIFALTAYLLPHVKAKVLLIRVLFLSCTLSIGSTIYLLPSSAMEDKIKNLMLSHAYPFANTGTVWMERSGIDLVNFPQELVKMPPVKIIQGSGRVENIIFDARNIRLRAVIDSVEATLLLRRFYFPGFISPSPDIRIHQQDALMAVTLPRGEHNIDLSLPAFKGEAEGQAISLFFLIIVGIATVFTRRRPLDSPSVIV